MADPNALLDYCSPVNTLVILYSRDEGMALFHIVTR